MPPTLGIRALALPLLAPAALGQDLYRRSPLLCDQVPAHQRQSPLVTTIPEIQMDVQPGPPPTQSTEICMNTATTAGSAGHTFPSAYAGKYVTLRNVIVTASGLNKNDIDGAYWFAVQPLGGGDEYAGLEVYSEVFKDGIEQGDLLDITGFVRDLGEEQMPHVLALMQGQDWYEPTWEDDVLANSIVGYTHLELCDYKPRGKQPVPFPVVVPAETFGYGCTSEARKYEGMLVRIEGASVQPCDNPLTSDKTSTQVQATIRTMGQYCKGNTLPGDVKVRDKFGQMWIKNEASGPASAYPLEARRLSPQYPRSPPRWIARPRPSTLHLTPRVPPGAGGERSSAGDRPEARVARYDLECDGHHFFLARQLGAGAAHRA
jgi:hypothetical protein